MGIRIKECFETSLGFMVLIETPRNSLLSPGTKIKNDRNELWGIKSVSFQNAQDDENRELGMECRGYHIEPIASSERDHTFNCELILKSEWEIVNDGEERQ